MNHEEYKEWLKSLTKDDIVVVEDRRHRLMGNAPYKKYRVLRTTKTQIVTIGYNSQEFKFNRNTGRQVGDSNYDRIDPFTQAAQEEINRWKDISKISNLAYKIGEKLGRRDKANNVPQEKVCKLLEALGDIEDLIADLPEAK